MDQAPAPRADPPPRRTERPAALAALAGLLLALGAAGLWLWDRPEVAGWLLAGLGASLLIGLAARRQDWLTPNGVLGAVLTGSLVFGGGGLAWGGLLLVFFVLANGLSRLRRRQKERLAVAPAKGARRDLGQVLANGGLGAAPPASSSSPRTTSGASPCAATRAPPVETQHAHPCEPPTPPSPPQRQQLTADS